MVERNSHNVNIRIYLPRPGLYLSSQDIITF